MSDAEASAADRRLDEHLELLRTGAPSADTGLAHRVVRRARWQRVIREPLRAAGALLAAVGEGVGVLTGRRRRRS